ncbi:3-oxoacyl-[acyl-carrier protein] reductase [Kribbella sp. VKM Ac-2527]|uniref:3-oxoacyl-[acyl-carrier protein] reductase n=1 Tax=Kribbella caucasensis TaxID=2512215 RepID=A0A4R6KH45_9ACTN|nr:SDR family oxidoreductase [Kribbella sp. VKM Ac-2527]TDO49777.1 3-oxoacyl-[acyl-carrier protein] reductase [Kribbella sp. VKM Ac-2527]
MSSAKRPVALVTGVGRRVGIGAGLAERLAASGWDVAFTYFAGYDDRMPWGRDTAARDEITELLEKHGARVAAVDADFEDTAAPATLFRAVNEALGPVQALVMAHCESVDSGILDTSIESFDRHFAVNARATWLLIKEFAGQYDAPYGDGRIIALTSDHTVGNLPYGASKGALDRITLAAARDLSHLGITANVINPGPIDTGWMTPEIREMRIAQTPLGRLGLPADTANLVAFLCSPEGGWMNGQLLYSNGGFAP